MAFSIRLSDEEKALADSYARMHNVSLGEAFKKALFEKSKRNMIFLWQKMRIANTLRKVK